VLVTERSSPPPKTLTPHFLFLSCKELSAEDLTSSTPGLGFPEYNGQGTGVLRLFLSRVNFPDMSPPPHLLIIRLVFSYPPTTYEQSNKFFRLHLSCPLSAVCFFFAFRQFFRRTCPLPPRVVSSGSPPSSSVITAFPFHLGVPRYSASWRFLRRRPVALSFCGGESLSMRPPIFQLFWVESFPFRPGRQCSLFSVSKRKSKGIWR